MSDVLAKFEELAERARSGDGKARRTFYAEAARLFPADFGEDHPSVFYCNIMSLRQG